MFFLVVTVSAQTLQITEFYVQRSLYLKFDLLRASYLYDILYLIPALNTLKGLERN